MFPARCRPPKLPPRPLPWSRQVSRTYAWAGTRVSCFSSWAGPMVHVQAYERLSEAQGPQGTRQAVEQEGTLCSQGPSCYSDPLLSIQ